MRRAQSRAHSIASSRVAEDLEREKKWEKKMIKIEKAGKTRREYIKYSVRTKARETGNERHAAIQAERKKANYYAIL